MVNELKCHVLAVKVNIKQKRKYYFFLKKLLGYGWFINTINCNVVNQSIA